MQGRDSPSQGLVHLHLSLSLSLSLCISRCLSATHHSPFEFRIDSGRNAAVYVQNEFYLLFGELETETDFVLLRAAWR